MDYASLIALILGAIAQYGPTIVKDVSDLIHGNPQTQGETDAAYITRINALVDTKLSDALAKDAAVEAGDTPTIPQPPTP
jgi:hypothetical protein